jgi:hypothetical protein
MQEWICLLHLGVLRIPKYVLLFCVCLYGVFKYDVC